MKLTDEMIEKKLEGCTGGYVDGYTSGSEETRDFYENQKCVTCNTINICTIRKFVRDNIDLENFGCTEWEHENQQVTED